MGGLPTGQLLNSGSIIFFKVSFIGNGHFTQILPAGHKAGLSAVHIQGEGVNCTQKNDQQNQRVQSVSLISFQPFKPIHHIHVKTGRKCDIYVTEDKSISTYA